jgi:saccharopine dehydrogenase (NAD+, L-lysine-forming)
MTFGQEYLTHLRVMQNIGITSIKPIMFQGREIIPIEFLKALLPEPGNLGENYTGETSIGCQIKGIKDGKEKTYYIWNNCKHQDAYSDCKAQGVSYTTGVPAMLGAKLMMEDIWMKPGVYNTEEMNPDPFMQQIGKYGLPWHEEINPILPHKY